MASGEKRARSREKSGTSASTSAAVASVITGSAVAGQALRNAASRNAFDATWCASMMPAVLIATVVSAVGLTPLLRRHELAPSVLVAQVAPLISISGLRVSTGRSRVTTPIRLRRSGSARMSTALLSGPSGRRRSRDGGRRAPLPPTPSPPVKSIDRGRAGIRSEVRLHFHGAAFHMPGAIVPLRAQDAVPRSDGWEACEEHPAPPRSESASPVAYVAAEVGRLCRSLRRDAAA